MNTFSNEINKYKALNSLASVGSVVLFGGSMDKEIPVLEIAQSCDLNFTMYNRSIDNLSILEATQYYETCIAPIQPEAVLIHIGSTDIDFFRNNTSAFDKAYIALIERIKADNKKTRIAVISVANYSKNETVSELNRHLHAIADSEHCEFCDINRIKVWNPRATKEVFSFLYDTGFLRPLSIKKPVRDIVNLLYGYVNTAIGTIKDEIAPIPQVG
ncbi:MAG: SGNH/GDSL hydrolase family protein [Treponema sp.]|nr:SGNH/GDSL hydrolase family protein [Treponema sp.]